MAYCTQTNIEDRIGREDLLRLSDHDGDGTPDADVVEQAIWHAQGDLDSYLQVKFEVPIVPTPAVLEKHCVTMAVYYLQLGRDSVTENMRNAYKDILAWLKDVVAGKAALGGAVAPAESSGAPSVRYESQDRVFGRDKDL
jgi:phage gp36-like protein